MAANELPIAQKVDEKLSTNNVNETNTLTKFVHPLSISEDDEDEELGKYDESNDGNKSSKEITVKPENKCAPSVTNSKV